MDGWRDWFVTSAPQLSFILAFVFPFLRAGLRKWRGIDPAWSIPTVVHDVVGGVMMPNFLLLTLCIEDRAVLDRVDAHSLLFAGVLGTIYTLGELVGKGPLSRPPADTEKPNRPEENRRQKERRQSKEPRPKERERRNRRSSGK